MNIYIVSDHAGVELKNLLIQSHPECIDLSPLNTIADDYPDFARTLALKLESEPDSLGVAICGSGQGICIAINKFNNIRAGLITQVEQVNNLKQHNNANVMCLSNQFTNRNELNEIFDSFISISFSNETRHIRRINKIKIINNIL